MPRGRHRLRLESGDEIEVRSSQLVARWDPMIDQLLRQEDRSRAFNAETTRDDRLAEAVTLVLTTVSAVPTPHRPGLVPPRDRKGSRGGRDPEGLLDLSPVAHLDETRTPYVCRCNSRAAGQTCRRAQSKAVVVLWRRACIFPVVPGHVPGALQACWDMAVEWAGRTR